MVTGPRRVWTVLTLCCAAACHAASSHPVSLDAGSSRVRDAGDGVVASDAGLPAEGGDGGGDPSIAVSHVVESLTEDGFRVQEGSFEFFDIESCRNLSSCFGNNPSSPYGLYYLPRSIGQSVPEENARADGMSPTFRLSEDEALVFIGQTPPEVAYYSFRSYVFDRSGGLSGRQALFASLGDSLNHEVIGTLDAKPFESGTVVITSANESIEQRVRAALRSAHVPERAVNVDRIPASLCRMGLDASADTFTMLFRAAVFRSADARASYVAHPPARVFRVTPSATLAARPFTVPALRPKAAAPTEAALAASLDALERAVRKSEGIELGISVPVSFRDLDGFSCLADNSNCLGDNHDTTYATALVGRITPSQRLYVLGVNHAATGKATYANISVYAVDKLLGVAAVDDRRFRGTATRYLPDDPNAAQLFVWKLARDCGDDSECSEVPTDFPGLDAQGLAALAFRAYLEPGQHTSSSPDTLLLERVIKVGGL